MGGVVSEESRWQEEQLPLLNSVAQRLPSSEEPSITPQAPNAPAFRMITQKKACFLFVSTPFSGIEAFVRNIQAALNERSRDIESHWLFIEWSPKEWVASLPLVSGNWTLKGGLVARSRIRSLEGSGKRFDAVFLNSIVPLPLLGSFVKRVPVVLSLDTTPRLLEQYSQWYHVRGSNVLDRLGWSGRKNRLKRIYSRAEYLLPWSDMVYDSLIRDYEVSENKVEVVPPGIDLKKWKRSQHPTPITPSERNPRILFVGSDFERKGGDLVLKTARRKEFQHCEFHIVTRTALPETHQNIHVHTDLGINSEPLLSLYNEADIFVLPTRADFAPTTSICEAMAMKLPIISTNVGGLDKVVVDGNNGFIIPINNEELLADRLRALVSSRALRREMGLKGRAMVESKFDITKSVDTVIEFMKVASQSHIC
jgi:glycosyltransferase involved in cell wall biosynthesis